MTASGVNGIVNGIQQAVVGHWNAVRDCDCTRPEVHWFCVTTGTVVYYDM